MIVRGDTNSTLASALVASKLNIPLAHIEAGERSFNRLMPEEINRLVVDRLADLFFCVSQEAEQNLAAEGITDSVHCVGDVMLDALLYSRPIAHARSVILDKLQIEPQHYALATIHRAINTDEPEHLRRIIDSVQSDFGNNYPSSASTHQESRWQILISIWKSISVLLNR